MGIRRLGRFCTRPVPPPSTRALTRSAWCSAAAATATTVGTSMGAPEGAEAKKKAVVPGAAPVAKGPAPDWSALLQRLDPALVQALAATVQQTLKVRTI